MDFESSLRQIVATARRLAESEPTESNAQSEAVARTVAELQEQVKMLNSIEKPGGYKGSFGENSQKDDIAFIGEQVKRLKSAAEPAARNYARITTILAGLQRACEIAKRPQYAAVRPKIASIVEKTAGVFAEIDLVSDLNKPLEAIEKAVHSLYGDQSKNSTYYMDRRGKGHHEKAEGEVK
jgi:hypothetical protein